MELRFIVCLFCFVLGIIFSLQSGFRMIAYVNEFCTVISTSLGFIADVFLLFFTSKFAKESLKLKRFTGEKQSNFVSQCIRWCTIPLTLVIFFRGFGSSRDTSLNFRSRESISHWPSCCFLMFWFFHLGSTSL